jgi:hypothetical protein
MSARQRGFRDAQGFQTTTPKLLYLAIKNAGLRWRGDIEWMAAMGQFAIQFGQRFLGTAR